MRLLYDVSTFDTAFFLSFLFFGIFMLISFIVFYFYGRSTMESSDTWMKVLIAGLFTIIVGGSISSVGRYFSFKEILKNGSYRVVEGYVEDFTPYGRTSRSESFSIKSNSFTYSPYSITSAYNITRDQGGPVDMAKYLRIDYYDTNILRIYGKSK